MLAPGVPPAKAPRPQACMPAVCALLGAPTTPARIEQACSHVCICARACTWRTFEMVELSQAWRCQLILGKVDVFLRGKCRRKTKCAAPLEVWLLTNAFTRACTRTHTLVYSRTISHTHTHTHFLTHTHTQPHIQSHPIKLGARRESCAPTCPSSSSSSSLLPLRLPCCGCCSASSPLKTSGCARSHEHEYGLEQHQQVDWE